MGTDDSRERASAHYDDLAILYEKARPAYPELALRWMLGDSPLHVTDVGAGTGKLTRSLVALGHSVVAIEPSEGMRSVLRETIDGIEILDGTAEELPQVDDSVDAVLTGQAYQWFEHSSANREFARIVRPGGIVGLLFNASDRNVPWVAEMAQILVRVEKVDTHRTTLGQKARLEKRLCGRRNSRVPARPGDDVDGSTRSDSHSSSGSRLAKLDPPSAAR